jgi:hypothetical protein
VKGSVEGDQLSIELVVPELVPYSFYAFATNSGGMLYEEVNLGVFGRWSSKI